MKKIKIFDDLRENGKVNHITGIVYDLDEQYIYIVDIRLNRKWFHSSGERYKFKHNFTKKEIDNISIGSYIQLLISSFTKDLEFKDIKIKKSNESHEYTSLII